MNKSEAIKRLDAIEKEQAELRKIIEKGDKIVYNPDSIYVAVYNEGSYIMCGCELDGFVFYTLEGTNNRDSYAKAKTTGQECLDYHDSEGFDILELHDKREALRFMLDNM